MKGRDVVKGLILAAGLGTRLRSLTESRPKPVIAVANKPIILYAIDNLVEAGVHDIGIVVSSSTIDSLKETLSSYERASFSYIMQAPPEGLAHAVKVSRDFLGDDPFVMYLGDNLFQNGINEFIQLFQRQPEVNAVLALVRVDDPRSFGVVTIEDGRITNLIEKPKEPPSDLAVAGVYVFDACVHEVIEGLKPSGRGEYEITDAILGLIKSGKNVAPVEVSGWWKDTGKPEDILDANRLVLLSLKGCREGEVENSELIGQVSVEKGAAVRDSLIDGPAVIGAGALIEEAYIGPFTSVGTNVRVRRSELEYSVVEDESIIDSVERCIHSSLIGRHAEIRGQASRPRAHQLLLGDRSKIEIQS
jgi:glucose-1-phosphate thymidylyltransferase